MLLTLDIIWIRFRLFGSWQAMQPGIFSVNRQS